MRAILLLSCLWAFTPVLTAPGADAPIPTATPAATPSVQVVLELSDGSHLTGKPSIDSLKITTQYADAEILLTRLSMVELTGKDREAQVSFLNGDVLTGQIATPEITVKTPAGEVAIPLSRVRKIRIGPAVAPLPKGLVLHYSFDSDEGKLVTDESGSGNNGKVHNATYTAEGKAFGAMKFNGDGDAVLVGNPASLHLQDLTIMVWMKRGSTDKVSKDTAYGEFFGYGHGGYIFGINDEGYVYLSKADIHAGATSTFKIPDKDFHHVAVTREGGKFIFYLDGVGHVAEDPDIDDYEFSTDAAVGARADDLHKCFLGVIDEVSVFKRPLTADEVKDIYQSQK